MGETETTKQGEDNLEKAGEEETTASAKDESGADDDTEEGNDADDNNDDGSDDEEETDDDEDSEDDKKSKKSTSKDKDDDEDKEPPTRKRPIDFIKERQAKRNAKQGDKDKDKATGDEDEDDEIDPADEKTIGKIVDRKLKPLVEERMKEADEQEIKSFLTENPDFKPYEAKARKYMSHPSRKDVPISEIFYGVAGADLLKIGAKRGKIADNEAKKSKTGGGAQDAGGVKPVAEMSKAELEAKQAEVRSKMADRY